MRFDSTLLGSTRVLDLLARGVLRHVLLLLVLYEGAQDADFLVPIVLKIKPVLLAKSELQQIVVKRFFAHLNFGSSVFEREADEVSFAVDSVVQFAPQGHLLDDVGN